MNKVENQQPPPPESPPPPPPQPPVDQSPLKPPCCYCRPKALILIALAILAVVLGTGYLVGGAKVFSPKPPPVVVPQITPYPTPIPSWKTYTDSNKTFIIKYPESWISNDSGIINNYSPLSNNEPKLFKKGVISIMFIPSPKKIENIDDWFNKTIGKYKMENDSPYTAYKSITPLEISSYNVLKVEAEGYGKLNYTDYFVINLLNNYGVQISISYPYNEINEQETIIYQILSTFKFLESTTTPSPSKPKVCAQVITTARNPKTGECQEFPTPCDVPEGWERVGSCQ